MSKSPMSMNWSKADSVLSILVFVGALSAGGVLDLHYFGHTVAQMFGALAAWYVALPSAVHTAINSICAVSSALTVIAVLFLHSRKLFVRGFELIFARDEHPMKLDLKILQQEWKTNVGEFCNGNTVARSYAEAAKRRCLHALTLWSLALLEAGFALSISAILVVGMMVAMLRFILGPVPIAQEVIAVLASVVMVAITKLIADILKELLVKPLGGLVYGVIMRMQPYEWFPGQWIKVVGTEIVGLLITVKPYQTKIAYWDKTGKEVKYVDIPNELLHTDPVAYKCPTSDRELGLDA